MSYCLDGKKILLREMIEEDWIDVHKYASQPVVSQYQPWGPNTEADTKEFVQQVNLDAKKNPRTRFVFAIIHHKTKEMIGSGEMNIRDPINKAGEIAYIVNPDLWGKGIATETAKLLIEFGFNEFDLHRIYATCDTRNMASAKVLAKMGMIKEGRMREDVLIKDGWRDSFLYSILKREWK